MNGRLDTTFQKFGTPKQSSLISKIMIALILRDRRQQQQPSERRGHQAQKNKHSAVWIGASRLHLISRPTLVWQGCANALGKIGCTIGRLRGLVDQGAPPQLVKRQRRVYSAGVVEVAIYQTVEEMPDVKLAQPVLQRSRSE